MKMKKFISLALALSMISLPSQILAENAKGFSENFSAMSVGEEPAGFEILKGSGKIEVKERGGEKYAQIINDNDGSYVTLQKSFADLQGAVTAKTDFRQSGAKSDGNVILQLLGDKTPLCSVETENGNIVYRESGTNTVMVTNYSLDMVYKIHLEADLDSGKVGVYVDGTKIKENAPLLTSKTKINRFKAYAFMAPGFEVDNISVAPSEEIAKVQLDGADTQSIPPEGEQIYTYTAKALTAANTEIEAASFDFHLEPASVSGVTLSLEDAKTAKIKVSKDVLPDTGYKIVATLSSDSSKKAEKSIVTKNAVFEKIEIQGKGSISLYNAKTGDTYAYTAKVLDEFGNEMAGKRVNWSISGEGANYASIDQQGTLKVLQNGDISSYAEVKATLADDATKFAVKKVRFTDIRTYLSDETRRKAIKEYMDTALEYGKDTYRGSPRIADGINRDGEHIKWRTQNGDEVPIADMGNEYELLRTMIAYAETVGDPDFDYKERAYELYRYTMENDLAPNNLVYWGSHKAIDMRTGEPTGDASTGIGLFHEVEEKDMYFTPFYETNEEKAAEMVRSIWMAHMIDWSNLMFNRHAEYTKTLNRTNTWDNVGIYDEDYWKEDAFVRDYDGCTFFLASSEYISAAVELYERTGEEEALIWARRMAERYANLADKKTGIMPTLYATPYGDPRITDEEGNLSLNIRPAYIDQLAAAPYKYQNAQFGDRVYVQFAKDMEEKGLLDGINLTDHIDIPTNNPKLAALMNEDGAKALILEMYYNRTWPWVYGNSMFSILELVEAMGLENESDEGFPLFAKWMHGYKSYIDLAYEGNSKIKVTFACGIKLDKYVTAVPGYTSAKGSMLDSSDIDCGTLLPAVAAIYKLDRFNDNVVLYTDSEETVTVGDVKKTLWDFINSMADFYSVGYLGEPTEGIEPKLNMHTTCDDANALNAIIEIYRHSKNEGYLEIARIIANNIVENNYDGGIFAPSSQYGTWTSSYDAAVLMKLDAVINDAWSEALDFSFQSYVYHQAYYINEHGKIPTIQYEARYEEEYTAVEAKKIKVDKTAIKMNCGDIEKINVTVLPDDADSKTYYWEISDQSIVKIDDDNRIYAVGKGDAVIRAVIEDTAIESADIRISVE